MDAGQLRVNGCSAGVRLEAAALSAQPPIGRLTAVLGARVAAGTGPLSVASRSRSLMACRDEPGQHFASKSWPAASNGSRAAGAM